MPPLMLADDLRLVNPDRSTPKENALTTFDTAPIAILDPGAQPLRTLAIPIGFDTLLPGSLRTLLLLEEMYSGIVRWRCRLADGDTE